MRDSHFLCQIIAAADKKNEAEVLIYDDIGASWFGDGVSAKQFVKDLAALEDVELLTVRINSAGGDVFDGLAIYNALKRNDAVVVVEIDALAASIASVIALAGDEVRMADNAFFMIHNARGLEWGTAEDMRAMAELLDKVGGSLANVYAEKTGKPLDEIEAWMNAETWFTAEEAKDAGFVDTLTKGKKMAACADLTAFRRVPKALLDEPEPTAPSQDPNDTNGAGGGPASDDPPAPTQPAPEAKGVTMSDQDKAAQQMAGAAAERQRGSDIRALVREYNDLAAVNQTQIDGWLDDPDVTPDAVRNALLAGIKAKSKTAPPVKATVGAPRAENDPRAGFWSHTEFLTAVMENSGVASRASLKDERLALLATSDDEGPGMAYMLPRGFAPRSIRATVGSDEQGNYSDTYGGFLKPEQVLPGLMSIEFEGDPTAGLTRMLPMSAPVVKINARTDKNHATSVSGGLTFSRNAETQAITPGRIAIEQISMEASPLVGAAHATEQVMTDSPVSFAALLASAFSTQRGAHILNEKIRGLGGSQYLGILNSPAAVSVAKETNQAADTINYTNVLKMRASAWGYNGGVWMANHDCLPQIASMSLAVGTGGAPVYIPGSFGGRPDSLLGRPILWSEYMSTVGDLGDLVFVNWGEYLEGIYQPMRQDESIHVRFLNLERTFRFYERNCGAPWWRTGLTPNKGANTLSPIVTLDARA